MGAKHPQILKTLHLTPNKINSLILKSFLTVNFPSVFPQHTTHLSVPNLTTNNVTYVAPDLSRNVFSHDLMAVTGDEMEALFEREKFAYMEKSKNLQDQLETLKSDIEDLKRDDKITELDKIHR